MNMALFFFCVVTGFSAHAKTLHHNMNVQLTPDQHHLRVSDTLTFPECGKNQVFNFRLHGGLNPVVDAPATLQLVSRDQGDFPLDVYQLDVPQNRCQVQLQYEGMIYHPPQEELAPGSIQEEGVSLMGSTYWYPELSTHPLVSVDLTVQTPASWYVVGQGEQISESISDKQWSFNWKESQPQDAIYLLAGRFHRSVDKRGNLTSYVYLRENDDSLARMYHDLTHKYVELFSQRIGPYPYKKFATVENFWETGFGLPSITLLGPTVIRLPFLAVSSFPHEILHNWWGNGVYVDYSNGNWSEGLTSYMADHYFQEQTGQGVAYRRTALKNFASYVKAGNDFPLKKFKGRHNDSTKAVGYDKGLFFFHMLKVLVGETAFLKGLNIFYTENLFKEASYPELKAAFSQVTNENLDLFFSQWTERTGAPTLEISSFHQREESGRLVVDVILKQDAEPPYSLRVPWEMQLKEGTRVTGHTNITTASHEFSVELAGPVESVKVDPRFDVFRKPLKDEIPPILTDVIGQSEKPHLVVVSDKDISPAVFFEGWKKQKSNEFEFINEKDVLTFPESPVVWVVGWNNKFLPKVSQWAQTVEVELTSKGVTLPEQSFRSADATVAALVLKQKDTDQIIVFLGLPANTDQQTLARKITHYGKHSYLLFSPEGRYLLPHL